ncbi:MAG: TolB protein [Maribacter sp.]|jgi:TolB protein
MRIPFVLFLLFLVGSCKTETKPLIETPEESKSLMAGSDTLIYPEEKYFKSIRQITFGGDNAEAYWSWD